MSRRKVILPSWAVSSEASKDIVALKERFPDLSNGELIINTKKENVSLTTLNESGETAHFIDESKTIELVDSALSNAKGYVDSKVAEHDSAVTEVLKNYSTTLQTEEMVGAASAATLADVENKGYLTEHQSLEHLQEKINDLDAIRSGATLGASALQEVPEEYAKKTDIPSLEEYATKEWVENQIPSLDGYAKKSDIPSLEGYATKEWVENEKYATESFVTNAIAEAKLSGNTEIDLSGYVSEDELNETLKDYAKNTDIPTVPTKVSELENDAKYITLNEVPEVTVPTKVSELDNDSGFITDIPDNVLTEDDLNGYATEEWVENQIPSLDGYATTQWVKDQKYLTNHQDLSDYAKKSDLGLSEPITTKGGVWSDVIRSVFGDTIPIGITFEEFLRRMTFAELWPENISWATNLSVTGNGLTLSLNNKTNSVEVGTKLTLSNIKPYNSDNLSVKGNLTVSGLDYGYSLSIDNPELINNNVYELELATEKVDEAHVDTLAVKFTGFTTNSGNVVSDINTTSEMNVLDLYACGTTNYIKASQNSAPYKIASNNADINTEMYCASNMGSYSAITPEIEYVSASTAYTKNYTISTYRNTFYGITSSFDNCDSEFIRSLTATNRTIGSETMSFTVGSNTGKRFVIASPRKISKVLNTSLNQDVTAQLKETHKIISVPGANNMFPIEYNVYDNEWSIDFTTGHKWEITFE